MNEENNDAAHTTSSQQQVVLDFQAEFPEPSRNPAQVPAYTKVGVASANTTNAAKAPAVVPVIQAAPAGTTSASKKVVHSSAQLVLENTQTRQSYIA